MYRIAWYSFNQLPLPQTTSSTTSSTSIAKTPAFEADPNNTITITMSAPQVPTEQWAQIFEKTGGREFNLPFF